jgi:REP element-mobilizing transposase RayT
MPRSARHAPGGIIYHALNRAVARLPLFQKDGDYEAFERVLALALKKYPIRLLAYCVMPNHWHMVLWPREDGELSAFLRWLTLTHSMRWHTHYHTTGTGHLYQNRFKSFPIEADDHLYTVLRYVERNALRANLVKRAEDWLFVDGIGAASAYVYEQAANVFTANEAPPALPLEDRPHGGPAHDEVVRDIAEYFGRRPKSARACARFES